MGAQIAGTVSHLGNDSDPLMSMFVKVVACLFSCFKVITAYGIVEGVGNCWY